MMGYPMHDSAEAMEFFRDLIDSLYLVKVINEQGDFIQYLPGFGWYNTIHVVEEDEGYYLKVNNSYTMSVDTGWRCGDSINYEGQTYGTVKIGAQCWMTENLNVGNMINGLVEQTNNGTIEKYCYNNEQDSCDVYGGLYQWNEMMLYASDTLTQGICPDGWRLPTDYEWCYLTSYIDSNVVCGTTGWSGNDAGYKLKSDNGWCGGGNGSDVYGFMALPGGSRGENGVFHGVRCNNYWWSSTAYSPLSSLFRVLDYNHNNVNRNYGNKDYGLAVRCIKGLDTTSTNLPPILPHSPSPADSTQCQSIFLDLSWSCFDPDGDSISYDLYLGTDSIPSLITTGISDTTYDPGVLTYDTVYHWKIVAHDANGDSTEGPVWLFETAPDTSVWSCGDSMIYCGQIYHTIQIGTQCWIKENLNIGTYINSSVEQVNNDTIEKYCYENNVANCETYGGLYQWNEMMEYDTAEGSQGICPSGWHIPTDDDWCTLTTYADPTVDCDQWGVSGTDAGKKLKSTSGWSSGGNGTDEYCFTGMPGGYCQASGIFSRLGTYGHWWSATSNGISAWDRWLKYNSDEMRRYYDDKDIGFSVRCVHNDIINFAPDVPKYPFPGDSASGMSTSLTLLWSCSDFDDDTLAYDVYFDTDNPPTTLIADHQSDTTLAVTLLNDTTYYWRVIAYDEEDSTQSPVWTFSTDTVWQCGHSVAYEWQTYETVLIGTQCWMAENMNVGRKYSYQSNNSIIDKYCYNTLDSNCYKYGGLYLWDEAMQYSSQSGSQGICPNGWHIPTRIEWDTLAIYLGGADTAGGMMKEPGLTNWLSPNTGATNTSGFTALPGGYYSQSSHTYVSLGTLGSFWTSDWKGSYEAYRRYLSYSNDNLTSNYSGEYNAFSVRCIYNETLNQPPTQATSPSPADSAQNQSTTVDLH